MEEEQKELQPGDMLPADQYEDTKKKEEATSADALNKVDAGVQNNVLTRVEHPGVPSILKNVSTDACDKAPESKPLSTDELVNLLAHHEMVTTNDVVLHEKLKTSLEARGFKVTL